MKISANNPQFIKFLDTITKNIITNISLENYFTMGKDKKVATQYLVLKMLIKTVGDKIKINESILLELINLSIDRNILTENYELSGVLTDSKTNFESLFDMVQTGGLKIKKSIKVNKTTND